MTVVRDEVTSRLDALLASLTAGSRLPGERELAREWGVARMTLRRAVDEYVLDGRLERRPGSGTYLVRPQIGRLVGLTSFTDDVTRRGAVPGGRVVEFRRRAASGEVAARLSMPVGDDVLRIARVRTADGDPVALESVDIPAAYVPGLAADDVSGSLYAVLRDRYGIRLGSAAMSLWPELPDARTADHLGIARSSPCLYVEMTDLDVGGRTVMHARCHYRGDRYRMSLHIDQTGRGDRP
jgi:GntR family transcriptional regulator